MTTNNGNTTSQNHTLAILRKSFSGLPWRLFLIVVLAALAQFGTAPSARAEVTPVLEGYRDHSYPSNLANGGEATAEKPESKLWYNDGFWWGSMWSNSGNAYHIFRLDMATQEWIDTGTELDPRRGSLADTLWDGTHLYVVSHLFFQGGRAESNPANRGMLFRYSYNASSDTYSLDSNFPVQVTGGSSETLVVEKDTNGKLWVTYVQGEEVMVNRTIGQDWEWGTPFALGFSESQVTEDDISAIITYNQHVGIMWSSQTSSNIMYFAWHAIGSPDTQWQALRAFSDDGDDHINLKSLQSDNAGNIFAVVKGGSQADLITVLVCQRNGNFCKNESDWTSYNVYNSNTHNPTRPILLIDTTNRELYVFTRNHDENQHDGIYYKVTSLDNIQFDPSSIGTPFIKSETEVSINDPTSTKQNLSSSTGLVVLASDSDANYYFHNTLALDGTPQHTLNVSVVGNGSVDRDPPGLAYPEGQEVTLTAIPDPGWQFSGWSGDITGTNPQVTVTMTADVNATALFTEVPSTDRTLTALVNPTGSGTVTLNPPGGVYPVGTVVTVTANPNSGWSFSHWSGNLTGSLNPATITMDANKTITANFSEIPPVQYTLTMNVVGSGTVSPAAGDHIYNEGTIVPLQATPAPGWTFSGWSGAVAGDDNPTQITMDGDKTVTATFTPLYTLDVGTVGQGNVILEPPGGTYVEGTEVTLIAQPDPSWQFLHWSGDLTGGNNPATIVMDGNKSVTATFALPEHTLAVQEVGEGSVTLDPPGGEYAAGQLVTLTASPAEGWTFSGWSGDLTGGNNPATIVMDGDKSVTATFTPLAPAGYTLSVFQFGSGDVILDPPGGLYDEGTLVTLTADPAPGWQFNGWGGDLVGPTNPATLTMDSDKVVSATFVQEETGIQIEISANPMTATVGNEIVYSYIVANIGGSALHDVSVVDERLGAVTLDKTSLASGETAFGQLSDVVNMTDLPGPLDNTATAMATSALNKNVSDSATISVVLQAPPFAFYMPVAPLGQINGQFGIAAARDRPERMVFTLLSNRRLDGRH